MTKQILFAGGSGIVGRSAVRWFRERNPDIPVLVGGRNQKLTREIAEAAGNAEPVAIDLDQPRLGLAADVSPAAVVMVAPDGGLHGLRLAQDLGVPYLSIGTALVEVGPELALFAHRAHAAPVVLASHWAAGAALFVALEACKGVERPKAIRVGVVLDEKDPAGPASHEDIERMAEAADALGFVDGRRAWLSGDLAKRKVTAIDGRVLEADAFAPFDVISLHAVTGAPEIRFDLVTSTSSSRLRGGKPAAEIIVEVEGETAGKPTSVRGTIELEHGQASLTALSVVVLLEAALALKPGLYLPELVIEPKPFLDQLRAAGAKIEISGR